MHSGMTQIMRLLFSKGLLEELDPHIARSTVNTNRGLMYGGCRV